MTDRASAEGLREALDTLERKDGALPPRPTQYRRGYAEGVRRAVMTIRTALRDTGPRPDSGIDVELLARALHAVGWLGWDARTQAETIAAEYARLSTPRTETSE